MPVYVDVVARHPEWVEYRDKLQAGDLCHGPPFYTRLMHPDLYDLPCAYNLSRFDVIREYMALDAKTAIDLGCRYNTYGHLLEDRGLFCTGIEYDEREFAIAQKVHTAMMRKGQLFLDDILDHSWDQDVVIALNILKYVYGDSRFADRLRSAKFRQMFFAADHKKTRMARFGGTEQFAQTIASIAGRDLTYLGDTVYLIA